MEAKRKVKPSSESNERRIAQVRLQMNDSWSKIIQSFIEKEGLPGSFLTGTVPELHDSNELPLKIQVFFPGNLASNLERFQNTQGLPDRFTEFLNEMYELEFKIEFLLDTTGKTGDAGQSVQMQYGGAKGQFEMDCKNEAIILDIMKIFKAEHKRTRSLKRGKS